MATAGAIRAGRAFVELFADTSKLQAAMKNVTAMFKGFGEIISGWGTQMMRAGAAVVAPLVAVAKIAGSMGDNFKDMSDRTGITVEALSELDYVTSQTGTSLAAFEAGIKNMQKNLVEAAGGSHEATAALRALGLTVEKLRGQSPDEQFRSIAQAMEDIESPATRAALAMKIFGKSGTELIPLLTAGSAELQRLHQQFERLGILITTQEATAAADFNDKLTELWLVLKRAAFHIGSVLLPALTDVANILEETTAAAIGWVKENKQIVVLTMAAGTALVSAGAAFLVFGKALVITVETLGVVKAALGGVMTALSVIPAVLATPLGVISALAAGILVYTGAAGKALAWLGDRFTELGQFASDAMKGVAEAMLAGDVKLAAEILWTSLKVVWQTGVNALNRVWLTIKTSFTQVLVGTLQGAQAAWTRFNSSLTETWIKSVAELRIVWATFASWYKQAVEGLANVIAVKIYGADPEYVDQQTQFNVGEIKRQEASDIAGAQAEERQQLATQQGDYEAQMAQIGQAYENAVQAITEKNALATTEDQMRLRRLQEEFDILMRQSAAAKGVVGGGSAPGVPPGLADLVPAITAAKAAVFGTFSAAAAAAAGGAGGGNALVDAAKQTAANTAAIREGIEELNDKDGLTFD
jgi:TP901 family phage tail tape measure protein